MARTIQHGLGDAPNPDTEDIYELIHRFPLTYAPNDDPEVQEEMEKMQVKIKNGTDKSDAQDISLCDPET